MAQSMNILLVEDNPGDVLLTRKAFERSRVSNQLHIAQDGEEALEFLRRQGPYLNAVRPDLILLDINLPKISGHEVLAQIKSDVDLCRIPVVMLTSSERAKDVRAAYDAHANSYISKPADLARLSEVVLGLEDYWFALVTRPDAR